jgi:hypothetical protein
MSPTSTQQEPLDSAAQPPSTRPCLPMVQVLGDYADETLRLNVFYALGEAEKAAREAPQSTFYDARSIVLSLDEDKRLSATGDADPAELQRRLMAELRRAAGILAPGGEPAPDVVADLDWLDASPSPQYTVQALGLAEPDYEDPARFGPGGQPVSHPCTVCNWLQKLSWGTPPCCPG